ncbi:MAG: hypothetical protein M1834_006389 [Cirrosporium novae-zelandiae]|nr:MAG: hypothetical protein M1834_006389 [Cirrosporium novae-zelandiae]
MSDPKAHHHPKRRHHVQSDDENLEDDTSLDNELLPLLQERDDLVDHSSQRQLDSNGSNPQEARELPHGTISPVQKSGSHTAMTSSDHDPPKVTPACHIMAVIQKMKIPVSSSWKSSTAQGPRHPLPPTSSGRRTRSLSEVPYNLDILQQMSPVELEDTLPSQETVLYLAYGSNLCAKTFQGTRGIRPLSQINVVVPELVLTFDLPGIPYLEPCFANTRYRNQKSLTTPDYQETKWEKGLVGVVYEVTKKDYAHIIATEGGGASYQDILVDCYPLENAKIIPDNPTNKPFKAHTLYCPAMPPTPSTPSPSNNGRSARPDPNYAQPSPRYLKLITTGADEHTLPSEYQDYLHTLHPYTITTTKQRIGKYTFMAMWAPLLLFLFASADTFKDKNGRSPSWFVAFMGAVLKVVWTSYDKVFKPLFGDGERTMGENGGKVNDGGVGNGRIDEKDAV